MTHILVCVGNLTIIGSDNGLSPGRRQAITWTNVGILLIGPLGTNFSEMLIKIHTFSFEKIHLKMSSGKWRPFCLGLNVLMMKSQHLHIVADNVLVASCYQQATSHYLNHCWLIISGFYVWYSHFHEYHDIHMKIISSEIVITVISICEISLKITFLKFSATSSRGHWVNLLSSGNVAVIFHV